MITEATMATINKMRNLSPVVENGGWDWTDEYADAFCEVTKDIPEVGDIEVEVHRDFLLVWNDEAVWRVDVAKKRCTPVRPVRKATPVDKAA